MKLKLPLFVAVTVLAMFGVTAVSAKTAHVKSASLQEVQQQCTSSGGTITSWQFVINQIRSPMQAPASINVSWDLNGDGHADITEAVPLTNQTGPVGHYITTAHPGGVVTDATAVLADSWS